MLVEVSVLREALFVGADRGVQQAVSNEAQKIAAGIAQQQDVPDDEKALWTDAATKLRFPYVSVLVRAPRSGFLT